jgi:hypothetical protein
MESKDTKKLHDNLALITNMLLGCEAKLKDRSYADQWPQLEKDRIKLQHSLDNIKTILQTAL